MKSRQGKVYVKNTERNLQIKKGLKIKLTVVGRRETQDAEGAVLAFRNEVRPSIRKVNAGERTSDRKGKEVEVQLGKRRLTEGHRRTGET